MIGRPSLAFVRRAIMLLRRFRLCLLSCAAGVLVAGCGGGVYLSWGSGDGFAPSVSLAVSPTAAAPGDTVMLAAAASDFDGIDQVTFFRLDGDVATPLSALARPPYSLETAIPLDASGSVGYFARAIDNSGDRADSKVVTVSVVP
jgi:hypothetical protein